MTTSEVLYLLSESPWIIYGPVLFLNLLINNHIIQLLQINTVNIKLVVWLFLNVLDLYFNDFFLSLWCVCFEVLLDRIICCVNWRFFSIKIWTKTLSFLTTNIVSCALLRRIWIKHLLQSLIKIFDFWLTLIDTQNLWLADFLSIIVIILLMNECSIWQVLKDFILFLIHLLE